MILDDAFNFGLPTLTNDGSATISTNVLDAGSAINLFGPDGHFSVHGVTGVLTADDAVTYHVYLVGSDVEACNDSTNIVLGSTGVIDHTNAGVAMTTTSTVGQRFRFSIHQTAAKRYYAVYLDLAGTNPDNAAGGWCRVALTGQTNLPATRAAIPA